MPPITDNLLALLLAVIACFGNIVVAYFGVLRDRSTREHLTDRIEEARGGAPRDEHVVELISQTDSLHALCRKLLLAKGRREQAERARLVEPSATPQETPMVKKRTGVIRRVI